MRSSTYWVVAIVGVVVLVVGVPLRGSHHTIGLATIIVGVLVAIVGIVMALRGGGSAKAG